MGERSSNNQIIGEDTLTGGVELGGFNPFFAGSLQALDEKVGHALE
jgi:hypothetical protein